MQPFESMKVFNAIPPAVIRDDAAFVARTVDTAVAGGAQSLVFVCSLGSIDANLAVFKVMQSDVETDAVTLGGTPTEVVDILATVTPGTDDDNAIVVVIVDLKGPHKRYMQLQATAGNGQITLTWAAPVSDGGSSITNYKIYRGTSQGAETLLATAGNVLTYTDSSVTNNQTYYYKISAVNNVGEGPKSSEASATPTADGENGDSDETPGFELFTMLIAIILAFALITLSRKRKSVE